MDQTINAALYANPFVKDRYRPGMLTRYPSTDACRVVWTNGRAHSVRPPGERRLCPRFLYDTVIFVWTDTRRLPPLTINDVYSDGSIPLTIGLDTLAAPLTNDAAIRDIAIAYDEKIGVMLSTSKAFLTRECGQLQLDVMRAEQQRLSEGLKAHLNDRASALELPFRFVNVSLELAVTPLDKAAQMQAQITLDSAVEKARQDAKASLALDSAKADVGLLMQIVARRRIENEDRIETAAVSERIRREQFETTRMLDQISPESRIALAATPEMARLLADVRIAEFAKDAAAIDAAHTRVLEMLSSLAKSMSDLRPQTDVLNVNQK